MGATFNKVLLMGNLTREVKITYTPGGTAIANFGIAVNRKFKQNEEWKTEVCFVDITAWSKLAENCSEYLSKGKGVFIEGRLNFSTWKNNGETRNKLDVIATNIQFLPGGQSNGNASNNETLEGSTPDNS